MKLWHFLTYTAIYKIPRIPIEIPIMPCFPFIISKLAAPTYLSHVQTSIWMAVYWHDIWETIISGSPMQAYRLREITPPRASEWLRWNLTFYGVYWHAAWNMHSPGMAWLLLIIPLLPAKIFNCQYPWWSISWPISLDLTCWIIRYSLLCPTI